MKVVTPGNRDVSHILTIPASFIKSYMRARVRLMAAAIRIA
jgi:hypothetical protein